jgi:hypothetical protein
MSKLLVDLNDDAGLDFIEAEPLCLACDGVGKISCGWCNSGECPECGAPGGCYHCVNSRITCPQCRGSGIEPT